VEPDQKLFCRLVGNKQGIQLGVKYIMFGVKNLDLQAEMNVMRPIPIRQ
jgi:hypothetical protein